MLWVDKYKPNNISDFIGNKQNVKIINKFLKNWVNIKNNKEKVLLLSGNPGLGKTTISHLLSKINKYKVYELNTSDVRTKKKLKETVYNLINFKSFFGIKNILILDEIDGLLGNNDYGGMQFILEIIEITKIPIICICNNTDKIKKLANKCIHLKFIPPTLHEIKSYINKIALLEKISISDKTLTKLIQYKNYDIRNIITTLQFLAKDNKKIKYDSNSKNIIKNEIEKKDNIWNNIPKFYNNNLDINNKLNLYFEDTFMSSSMTYENIHKISNNLDEIEESLTYLSDSDILNNNILNYQDYKLMPYHGILSTISPSIIFKNPKVPKFLKGPIHLSKLNKINSNQDFLNKIRISNDKLDLLVILLSNPLINNSTNGIDQVLNLMDLYKINIDDYKKIMEYYPHIKINSKIKSSLTRKWNKINI